MLDHQPSRRTSLILLCALTALAAALRLSELERQSVWFDEAATWSQVRLPFLKMIEATANDNYPPLYNIVTWALVQMLGDDERVLRLPAALFGIALVPAIYLLGARVAGRTAGVVAAALLALSGFHLWYSVEARMYSLLALATCLYAWAALRDMALQVRASGWLAAGLGFALLMSHPYGALNWLAVSGIALVFGTRRWRTVRYAAMALAPFGIFGLALLWRAYQVAGTGFWIAEPTPDFVLQQFVNLTSGLFAGLLLCAIAALVPGRNPLRGPDLAMLLAVTLFAPIAGYVASLLTRPVLLDRYLIGQLPGILVLAAAGASRWFSRRWGPPLLFAIAVAAGALTLNFAPPARHDWRSTAAHVLAQLKPGDCVAVRPRFLSPAWRYYARDAACFTDDLQASVDDPAISRLFVVVADVPLEDSWIEETMPLVDTQNFTRVTLYVFARPAR